jgi:hypothetical protein
LANRFIADGQIILPTVPPPSLTGGGGIFSVEVFGLIDTSRIFSRRNVVVIVMIVAKKKKILVALIDALDIPLEGVDSELNCTIVCMCVQASFRRAPLVFL